MRITASASSRSTLSPSAASMRRRSSKTRRYDAEDQNDDRQEPHATKVASPYATLDGAVTSEQRAAARRLATTSNQRVSAETDPHSIDGALIQTAAVVGAGTLSLLIVIIGLAPAALGDQTG